MSTTTRNTRDQILIYKNRTTKINCTNEFIWEKKQVSKDDIQRISNHLKKEYVLGNFQKLIKIYLAKTNDDKINEINYRRLVVKSNKYNEPVFI